MVSGQQLLFWSAAVMLAYTYLGYPLLISVSARLGGRPHRKAVLNPGVSILVVVHNEASRIRQRIENLLALDYDTSRLEIVIASDASNDATVELTAGYREEGVRVVTFDQHRGKPAVLNDLVPHLKGEIVVLMDVRQRVESDALHKLVDNFADPDVGAVSGELILTGNKNAGTGVDGVGFYWRYEKWIRRNESRVDSTIGVTGALYAIRRELFEPIPDDTLIDDVLIPMQIVRKGYRVLFESGARASESLSASPELEFRRKVRTIAGNFQLLFRQPWLLNPFVNRLWLQTVSHKFCRLLCPALLVIVLVMNLLLTDSFFYQSLLVLQVLFYTMALIAHLLPKLAKTNPLLSVPHAFCLLNWCTATGFYRFIRGRQQVTWADRRGQHQG